MSDQFKALNESEFSQLKEAVVLITVLIAGADGKIEREELAWAEKVVDIRSYHQKGILKAFYENIDLTFADDLKKQIGLLPSNVVERNEIITKELTKINEILAKLDPKLGAGLHKSFLSLAQHVAKASGGVMGFFTINSAEAKVLNLNMISPIEYDNSEEEE